MKQNILTITATIITAITLVIFSFIGCSGGGGGGGGDTDGGGAADTTAPTVSSILSTSVSEVRIEYSESVDQTTAETIANYTITDQATGLDELTITEAVQNDDTKIVR